MTARRTITCLLLAVYAIGFATPAYADPIETRHVTQVFTGAQRVPDLRLRGQDNDGLPRNELLLPTPTDESFPPYLETIAGMDLTVLTETQDPQKVPQPDVEIAICDCGDLWVPVAGGFPKWPLLFLAGIPLFFLNGDEELPPGILPTPNGTPPSQTSTPTPTPNNTVPEPASLLLLLTGVCAVGVRLRKSMKKSSGEEKNDGA